MMKMVRVTWVDAATVDQWQVLGSLSPIFSVTSVGYLLKKTKKRVVLVQSVSENDQQSAQLTLPRVAVRSIKRLR